MWWCPNPRFVLFPDELKIAKSIKPLINKNVFEFTVNRAFPEVIHHCKNSHRPGQDGTWITRDILDAYCGLHRRGLAHSIEIWERATQRLIGGLYGVSLGRMFFGESMFARETDASKVALAALVHLLRELELRVIDCQQNTAHLASLGAREISRAAFLRTVEELAAMPPPDWSTVTIELPDA
jgi:leucyl/phenylalanyl-tRNA--protein transferase